MSITLGVVDHSITAGVAATAVLPKNSGRNYLMIQNLHATAIVYVNVAGGTAVAGAAGTIRLAPGDALWYEEHFIPSGAVSIISDTASTPVTVLEG